MDGTTTETHAFSVDGGFRKRVTNTLRGRLVLKRNALMNPESFDSFRNAAELER